MYNHLFLGLDAHTPPCTLTTVNDKDKVVSTLPGLTHRSKL